MSLSIHMIFIEKRQDLSDQQPPQRELLQNFLHYALFLLTSSDSSHQALSIDIVFVPIRPHLDKFCRILFNIFVWCNFVTRPFSITQAKIHGILLRLRKKSVDAG